MAIEAGSSAYWQAKRGTVQSGLVGHWDSMAMSSRTGNIVYDLAGNNNGTLTNGATFEPIGMGFDGTNDGILTSYAGINTALRSITCWFRTTRSLTSGQYMSIISWGLDTGGSACYVAIGTDGNFGTNAFGASQYGSAVGYNNVNTGIWTYGCVVNDGTTWSIYTNAQFRVSKTMTTNPSVGNSVRIGYWSLSTGIGSNSNFDGNLEDLRLYNRALSQSEITQNFNATRYRFGV